MLSKARIAAGGRVRHSRSGRKRPIAVVRDRSYPIGVNMKIASLVACVASLVACAEIDRSSDLLIIDQVEGNNFFIDSGSGKPGVFSAANADVKKKLEMANDRCPYAVFFAHVEARSSDTGIYDISIDRVISTRGLTYSEKDQAVKAVNRLPYKTGNICFPLNR